MGETSSYKTKITAVVHTYNAARYLEQTLESLRPFDEVLVCDMYSTDETIAIAERFGCRIIYHEYTGGVPEPARNWALHQARNEWVLAVDADEVVPSPLCDYLHRLAAQEDVDGAYIARKNYFMGRFMHASYPDYILRFFRQSKTYWPTTIHSLPTVDGRVVYLPRRRKDLAFIHLNDPGLRAHIEKMNLYTDNEVERRAAKRKTTPCFSRR